PVRVIPQWIGANQEPSIGTVESANASFGVYWDARSQTRLPRFDQFLTVLRMNRFPPAPALRLFGGHTRIVQPHLIEEVAVAIGTSSPCCCGDRIDDGGKIPLARLPRFKSASQGFLRPLAFNCDERETRGRLHQSKVLIRRHTGLCRIHCKRAEDFILFRHYRLGPPRPYSVLKGKGTMFLPPGGFDSNIRHNDSRLQESGSATQPRVRSHRQGGNRRAPIVGTLRDGRRAPSVSR